MYISWENRRPQEKNGFGILGVDNRRESFFVDYIITYNTLFYYVLRSNDLAAEVITAARFICKYIVTTRPDKYMHRSGHTTGLYIIMYMYECIT